MSELCEGEDGCVVLAFKLLGDAFNRNLGEEKALTVSSFPEPWAPGKLSWPRCPLACQDAVTTPSHMAKLGL